MRADTLASAQLLMARSIDALADHINNSTGYWLTPVDMPALPAEPKAGMIACITNSNVRNWGQTVVPYTGAGGGPYTVLAWYNGTNWVVIGQ